MIKKSDGLPSSIQTMQVGKIGQIIVDFTKTMGTLRKNVDNWKMRSKGSLGMALLEGLPKKEREEEARTRGKNAN